MHLKSYLGCPIQTSFIFILGFLLFACASPGVKPDSKDCYDVKGMDLTNAVRGNNINAVKEAIGNNSFKCEKGLFGETHQTDSLSEGDKSQIEFWVKDAVTDSKVQCRNEILIMLIGADAPITTEEVVDLAVDGCTDFFPVFFKKKEKQEVILFIEQLTGNNRGYDGLNKIFASIKVINSLIENECKLFGPQDSVCVLKSKMATFEANLNQITHPVASSVDSITGDTIHDKILSVINGDDKGNTWSCDRATIQSLIKQVQPDKEIAFSAMKKVIYDCSKETLKDIFDSTDNKQFISAVIAYFKYFDDTIVPEANASLEAGSPAFPTTEENSKDSNEELVSGVAWLLGYIEGRIDTICKKKNLACKQNHVALKLSKKLIALHDKKPKEQPLNDDLAKSIKSYPPYQEGNITSSDELGRWELNQVIDNYALFIPREHYFSNNYLLGVLRNSIKTELHSGDWLSHAIAPCLKALKRTKVKNLKGFDVPVILFKAVNCNGSPL